MLYSYEAGLFVLALPFELGYYTPCVSFPSFVVRGVFNTRKHGSMEGVFYKLVSVSEWSSRLLVHLLVTSLLFFLALWCFSCTSFELVWNALSVMLKRGRFSAYSAH